MNRILLRPATPNDSDTVVRILTTSRNTYLPFAPSAHSNDSVLRWVSKVLIPTGDVIIANDESDDVGVLATSIDDDGAWIDQLYVAPGFIGQGIGKALLIHALDNLPRPIRLWTFQENKRAIVFYEHHNFIAIKRTNGEDNEERCPDILYEYTDN